MTIENSNVQDNKTNGSLFQLFTSPFFDIHIIIYYLEKNDSNGIIDYLINQLSTSHIYNSFLYLPQIISMISNRTYSESIEYFLLDRCINQIKFSLIIYWLVLANNSSEFCQGKYNHLIDQIEITLVNGHHPFVNQYSKKNLNEDIIYQNNFNKEARSNYFYKVLFFYQNLKFLCEKLWDIKSSIHDDLFVLRDQALMDQLAKFNKEIRAMYKEAFTKNVLSNNLLHLFRGIILPFNDSNRVEDEYNSIIVNILNEYSFCFNTKARVLIKLVVECIRIYECELWDSYYIKDTNGFCSTDNNSSSDISHYNSINDFFNQLSIKDSIIKLNNNNTNNNGNGNGNNSNCNTKTSNGNKIYLSETSGTLLQIKPFGRKWSEVLSDIKAKSHYRNFQSYSIKSFIAKANDDLRQELLTMQLIRHFSNIFKEANIPLTLFPYEILITSPLSGLIEFLPNTISIDLLKKQLPNEMNLNDFFRQFFFDNFEEAQKNFAESLAGYSLITYVLNIKDRHNGNILLDLDGHIIHIDFGFILGISPGNFNFESAPFKLTTDYIDILDGTDSFVFDYFKSILTRGFREIRNHYESCEKLIQIMSKSWDIPCFYQRNIDEIISQFEKRFHFDVLECNYSALVDNLVNDSLNNWRTIKYDSYQKYTNNIMP